MPGIAIAGGVFGASLIPGGRGWRGPDKICPGRGEGTGFAGMLTARGGAEAEGGAAGPGAGGGAAGGAGVAAGLPALASGGRTG